MTVALCTSALVLFPMYSLQSFAYVGVAVVASAAVAEIVVTPAAIALLGQRLTRRLHGRACPRTFVSRPIVDGSRNTAADPSRGHGMSPNCV